MFLMHSNYGIIILISDTFGVESVVITDTTGGRVCLECSFSSFSTDTGCTVELVSSDSSSSIIQYIKKINRSGNGTAEGCVSGVTEGVYDVRVYDQRSSGMVHDIIDVTVLSLSTATATSKELLPKSKLAITSSESQSE